MRDAGRSPGGLWNRLSGGGIAFNGGGVIEVELLLDQLREVLLVARNEGWLHRKTAGQPYWCTCLGARNDTMGLEQTFEFNSMDQPCSLKNFAALSLPPS